MLSWCWSEHICQGVKCKAIEQSYGLHTAQYLSFIGIHLFFSSCQFNLAYSLNTFSECVSLQSIHHNILPFQLYCYFYFYSLIFTFLILSPLLDVIIILTQLFSATCSFTFMQVNQSLFYFRQKKYMQYASCPQ